MSSGRWIGLGPASRRRHSSTWSGSNSDVADRVAPCRQEGEAHAAADRQPVDDVEQRVDDADLVAHLRPAQHGDERAASGPRGGRGAPRPRAAAAAPPPPAGSGAGRRSRRGRGGRRRTRRPRRRPDRRRASATKAGSLASSPGSKRRFSSRSTPGASSAKRARTGAIEYVGSGLPFGRPRWLHAVTWAPCACSHAIVGSAARMRKSSVIRSRLQRHVEVGPQQDPLAARAAAGPRAPEGHVLRVLRPGLRSADEDRHVDQAVRVAPLVVVPAEHLDEVAVAHGEPAVEDAAVRVADDVGGHERLLGVLEHPLQRPLSRGGLDRRR